MLHLLEADKDKINYVCLKQVHLRHILL